MQYTQIKQEILRILQKNQVDLATVVVGTGETYYKARNRFVFDAGNRKEILDKTALYAIKYFHTEKIFILWEVWGTRPNKSFVYRSCLNIDAGAVLNSLGKTDELRKGIEFQWRNKEIVRVFDRVGLENYIANNFSKE